MCIRYNAQFLGGYSFLLSCGRQGTEKDFVHESRLSGSEAEEDVAFGFGFLGLWVSWLNFFCNFLYFSCFWTWVWIWFERFGKAVPSSFEVKDPVTWFVLSSSSFAGFSILVIGGLGGYPVWFVWFGWVVCISLGWVFFLAVYFGWLRYF